MLAFGNFVVLGQEGVWVESNGIIRSGDIGANNSGSGPYLSDNEEVVIGQNVAFSDSTSRVLGDSVNLKDGVQAPYVYYNNITGNGTALNPYAPLVVPLLPDLPLVPSFTPGTQNLDVAQNGTLTLDAGEYGDLIAHNNSTVTFNGGIYTFTNWDVWQRVKLYFAAPTEIRIADKMDTDLNTFVGPAPSASGLTARDIRIIIMGINGGSGAIGASPKAGEIGRSNTVIANVYVPNGTLWIRSNTNATGAFIARWVHIAQSVELILESGF